MAVPLQYQSQFVPTDFNTVGNVLGMFRQDMAQRNKEFDQGQAFENAAIAEAYGTESFDNDLLNQQVQSLETRINDAVTKYGGDYGAASQDIARLIAKERSNPFWKLNARKVEQIKEFEDLKRRNPSLIALRSPKDISLSQKGLTPEDISYDVLDPTQAQSTFNSLYGNLAKQTKGKGTTWRDGYQMLQTQIGLSQEERDAMKNNPEQFEAFVGSMGQLQNYKDNPQVMQQMKNMYSSYVDTLDGGIHETVGMTPAQVEDRAARKEEREFNRLIKLQQLDLARDKVSLSRGASKMQSGTSGYKPLAVKPPFEKPKEVLSGLGAEDEDTRVKASEVYNRIITPEWVNTNLSPEQIKKYGSDPKEIINNIDKFISEKVSENIDAPGNDLEYVTNALEKGMNWLKTRPGITIDKSLKEAYDVRSRIKNELDVYLTAQGDDAKTPYVGISGEAWDYINSAKGVKNKIIPEQMTFETSDLAGKSGEKLAEESEFKKLLKNGFDIHNVYGTDKGVRFEIRDKSTGTPYIVGLPHEMALEITQTVSPALTEMEIYKDYTFVGNKVKVGDRQEELPFTVKSEWKQRPDGKKFVYTIPEISHMKYIKMLAEERTQEYNSLAPQLKMLGLSEEEIEDRIQQEVANSINNEFGIDEMSSLEYKKFLNSPYETELKSEILRLAGK